MNNVINVTSSAMPPYEEYCAEIKELWESRWLTHSGVKHQQLEKELEAKIYPNQSDITHNAFRQFFLYPFKLVRGV